MPLPVLLMVMTMSLGRSPQPDEARLFELINNERVARHIPPLSWDPALSRLARLHAMDMRAAGRVSHHSTADGADFAERLARTDYRASAAAENVALDRDVASAHRGLMNSPGHRANILNPALTAVGIGIERGGDQSIYVAEDFASRLDDVNDAEALLRVREALFRARSRSATGPFEEDRDLSRRLAATLRQLVASDSVRADPAAGFGAGWIFAWTAPELSTLPRDAAARASDANAYALAVKFGKTRSYPFGTWWIVLALRDSR